MHPSIEDIQEIYDLWKIEFAFDDGGFTDDFFKRNFALENCYILRFHGVIVATLCAFPHTMCIQDYHIPTYFICGVITKKKYRHQGYMKILFQSVFDEHQSDCALFLLQAYNEHIYTSLDFHTLYQRHVYEITQENKQTHTIVPVNNALDMKELSDLFLADYDGYLIRDEAFYKNYIQEAIAQDVYLFGIYEQEILQGFGRLDIHEKVLDELMYRNEHIRKALLAYAKDRCENIRVHSFIPLNDVLLANEQALMVRLHSAELLKNIFQHDVNALEDVYKFCKKPLYHYGSW